MGERHRPIRARSAPGQVAGAATETARTRSPSSKTACPTAFSTTRIPRARCPANTRRTRRTLLAGFSCPETRPRRPRRQASAASRRCGSCLRKDLVSFGRGNATLRTAHLSCEVSMAVARSNRRRAPAGRARGDERVDAALFAQASFPLLRPKAGYVRKRTFAPGPRTVHRRFRRG